MANTDSHRRSVKSHLEIHGSITPMEALQYYGCYRLAARVCELRKQGLDIRTEKAGDDEGNYAKYVLVPDTDT